MMKSIRSRRKKKEESCRKKKPTTLREKKTETVEEPKKKDKKDKPKAKKDPWPAEETAKKVLSANKFDSCSKEFGDIANDKPDKGKCSDFTKNEKKNQTQDFPILDENRAKISTDPSIYVNANKLSLPELPTPTILAQIPDPAVDNCVEVFWHMIFSNSITQLCFIYYPMEASLAVGQLMPTSSGAFLYFGKMFVNNKKVETIGKETTAYTLEVLPDGCSNSVMVTVYHFQNWKKGKAPGNVNDCVAVCEKILKANDSTAFCSLYGPGRGGTMALMVAAFFSVHKNVEIKLKDVLAKLRTQRYGIVETSDQYAAVHTALATWFKSKANDEGFTKSLSDFSCLKD